MIIVGLSHKNTPLSVRERLAIRRDALPDVLTKLVSHPSIAEAVVLSTCNRVEVYAAARQPATNGEPVRIDNEHHLNSNAIHGVVNTLCSIGGDSIRGFLSGAAGHDAVRHLFRVAASLDSLVVGEPQILGQLKDAIEIARETKTLGRHLGQAMHRAIKVGRRVRAETSIGSGQVSVSSVAIDLARQIFGDLSGHTALLIGAGEMAEAAARLLVRSAARLLVVNRSPERAQLLARDVGGQPCPWGELPLAFVEADIVISSTSSQEYVISKDLVRRARKARRGRSLFLIDIAVPRDIDPEVNQLDNVYLYDVDDLSQIVSQSLESRAAEAARADAIVVEEAERFETWTLERSLTPTIVGLRERTRAILCAELERSLCGKLKHLGAGERQALTMMLEAATNKLLHHPVTRLRSLASDPRAADHVDAIRELFNLGDEQPVSDGFVSPSEPPPALPSEPPSEKLVSSGVIATSPAWPIKQRNHS